MENEQAHIPGGAGAPYRPEFIPGDDASGVLFLCDHASNELPPEYGTLGLSPEQLQRHIGWDIGAADVTRALARHFGAPAILTRFSRLLIDPNRGADDPTLVMRISDGAIIPGNRSAGAEEIEHRRQRFWQPYRDAVRQRLDAMLQRKIVPAIVSIHSFTHQWRNRTRPWQIGLLWDSDPRLASRFFRALQYDPELNVGDNEPYDGALVGDTLNEHGTNRGLPHVLIEFRQDLIADSIGAANWAQRIAAPLAQALQDDDIRQIQHFASRAGTGRRYTLDDT